MINPVLSNFRVDFGDSFFPDSITKKYNEFLHYKNNPIRDIASLIYESIQEVTIPGITLSPVAVIGLNNTGKNPDPKNFNHTTVNKYFPGTASQNEIIESTTVTITFLNRIINWMYCYEILHSYYKRSRNIDDFYMQLSMMDSAEVPMIRFLFGKCFISTIPGLTFSTNQSFLEAKTFECTFTFNKMDTNFVIPTFDVKKMEL